ncbi:ATP-dependent endonuclease, partial [Streptomyces sp. NPDC001193]
LAETADLVAKAGGSATVHPLDVTDRAALRAWQTFLRQPAQDGRPRQQQLRRFLGTKKGRKIRYGGLLVEALAPGRVPAPLEDLLTSL